MISLISNTYILIILICILCVSLNSGDKARRDWKPDNLLINKLLLLVPNRDLNELPTDSESYVSVPKLVNANLLKTQSIQNLLSQNVNINVKKDVAIHLRNDILKLLYNSNSVCYTQSINVCYQLISNLNSIIASKTRHEVTNTENISNIEDGSILWGLKNVYGNVNAKIKSSSKKTLVSGQTRQTINQRLRNGIIINDEDDGNNLQNNLVINREVNNANDLKLYLDSIRDQIEEKRQDRCVINGCRVTDESQDSNLASVKTSVDINSKIKKINRLSVGHTTSSQIKRLGVGHTTSSQIKRLGVEHSSAGHTTSSQIKRLGVQHSGAGHTTSGTNIAVNHLGVEQTSDDKKNTKKTSVYNDVVGNTGNVNIQNWGIGSKRMLNYDITNQNQLLKNNLNGKRWLIINNNSQKIRAEQQRKHLETLIENLILRNKLHPDIVKILILGKRGRDSNCVRCTRQKLLDDVQGDVIYGAL